MTIARVKYKIFADDIHLAYSILEDFSLSKSKFEQIIRDSRDRLPQDTILLFIKPYIVLSPKIVALAFYYALNAFKLKINISKYLDLETLLYLNGSRQITSVIENIVWLNEPQMLICCCSTKEENMHLIDFPVKTISPRKVHINLKPDLKKISSLYDITEEELKSVTGTDLEKFFKLIAFRMSLFFAENSRKTALSSNFD